MKKEVEREVEKRVENRVESKVEMKVKRDKVYRQISKWIDWRKLYWQLIARVRYILRYIGKCGYFVIALSREWWLTTNEAQKGKIK